MGWLRRRKASQPLIAGRDRPDPTTARQPTYSYYANRRSTDVASTQSTERMPLERIDTRTRWWSRRRKGLRRRAGSFGSNVIVWVCVVIVGVCLVKLLWVSPSSRVVVIGESASTLPTEAYEAYTDSLLQSSVLNLMKPTLNTRGIASSLEQRFPELQSVVLETPLIGNRPVLYVTAQQPVFLVESSGGLYTISKDGYILTRQLAVPDGGLIRLKDTASRQPKPGEQYLPSSTVSFALTVSYQLGKSGHGVQYLELPASAPYELDAFIVGEPYYIRFSLQSDPMRQSGGAIGVLKQIGPSPSISYLDMRVVGRAYYK